MKVRRGYRSKSVQDHRGARPTRSRAGRVGTVGGGAAGLGALAVVLFACLSGGGGGGFGFDQLEPPPAVEQGGQDPLEPVPEIDPSTDPEAYQVDLVNDVTDRTTVYWNEVFTDAGEGYVAPTVVLFRSQHNSACGGATSAIGPHYCPVDQTIYIDLGFYDDMLARLGGQGDFAEAYVLAHEVAHHVQTEVGVSAAVRELSQQYPGDRNQLSVLQELQADCLAGAWAFSAYEDGVLEAGDIDEALGAAAAVGDDRIQQRSTGRIDPEGWTHGSAEQRVDWFTLGFETGDPSQCDTFDQAGVQL